MKNRHRVCVVGNGGWGTALALLLFENGNDVTLWGHSQEELDGIRATGENKPYLAGVKIPDGIRLTSDPSEAVRDADLVVLAVASHF